MLGAFTLFESVSVCALTASLEPVSVLISIAVFWVATSALWIVASMTNLESHLTRNLFIGLMVGSVFYLVIDLLLLITWGAYAWMWTLWAGFGVIFAGLYVIIDLMYIMTPGQIAQDDYILGAILLYVDMVRMFFYILMILGENK